MNYIKTIYGNYKKTSYPDELCKYLIDRFNIKKGSHILDVGCGNGFFMDSFLNHEMHVDGIDREGWHSAIKEVEDLEKSVFPCISNSYDIVFSKSVIEHIYKPEHFIKECERVLKPGGQLIILTPDWITQKDVFYEDCTHVHPYTTTSLKDLLLMNDFKNVESELFYQLPILWKYKYLKLVSKFLQLLFKPKLKRYKNKFVRWSIELMVLGYGVKK